MAPPESPFATRTRGEASFSGLDTDRTVVWLRGEHDLATVAELAATLARAIAIDDADLVIDLSDVQFMDASTVRLIVRTRDFLRTRARNLGVRAPSDGARLVLDRCGLSHLVDPHPVVTKHARLTKHLTGTMGALATWVRVPVAEPAALRQLRSDDEAIGAHEPGRVPAPITGPTIAEQTGSLAARHTDA